MPENADAIEGHLEQMRELIAEHGWAIQAVLGKQTAEQVPFQYTVGLTAFDHPEFVLYGLGAQLGGGILNDLGERVRAGERFSPGDRLEGVLTGGYVPELVAVEDDEDLVVARTLYDEIDALQVVLPDREHRMPWDDGFAIDLPLRGTRPTL